MILVLKRTYLLVLVLLLVNGLTAQQVLSDKEEQRWVDSVFQSLSLEERIGQLFMVAAYSNKENNHFPPALGLV